MKKKLTVLIAGPLPPPAGGISIHIQRLAHLMNQDVHCDFIDEASTVKKEYFHIRQFNPVIYLRKISHSDIFFIHSGNRLLKKIHILSGRILGRKIIITLHGYGNRRPWPFRQIDGFFFRMANKIILVNEGIFDKVGLPADKCIVKHAFLPPIMESEPALPEQVQQYIQKARDNQQWVLCANASRLHIHNGHELYGLDMCIELMKQLLRKGIPAIFIFVLTSKGDAGHLFDEYQKLLSEDPIRNHFFLVYDNLSFVRLVEASDMVIRPTNADGDALTVREAIYLGRPVIVSDIVSRPEGSILFRTRDQDDLLLKVESVIGELRSPGQLRVQAGRETSESFKQFYKELFTGLASA